MKLNIAIIGSGIGGLASAIRLAVRGHDVTVFEQAEVAGGMIKQLEWQGFRWDVGPSSLVLPDQVEELFLLAGEEMKVAIRNYQLEEICKYIFSDGIVLDAFGDADAFIKEARLKTGEPVYRIKRYLKKLRNRYELTQKVLLAYTYNSADIIVRPGLIRSILTAWKNDLLCTAHFTNSRSFNSKHLIQLFDWLASSQGSNPYRAPSNTNLNAHFVHNLGVFYPEKGMFSLAKELYLLAKSLGVNFKFGAKVEAIELNLHTVRGIRTSEGLFKADIVVSDIDIHQLYNELLPLSAKPKKYIRQEASASAVVFCWAVERESQELSFQNIFLSADQKHENECIYNKKVIGIDPTLSLHISSKIVEGDAPGGFENWVVVVRVPANSGQDWAEEVRVLREKVVSKINSRLQIDIEGYIKKEFIIDPVKIAQEFGANGGSLYGSSQNTRMATFRRHPNYLNRIHGLYFAGKTVQPGGGLPMCLSSARNIDFHIARHYSFKK